MAMALISLTWETQKQVIILLKCILKFCFCFCFCFFFNEWDCKCTVQRGVQLFLQWAIMQGVAMLLQNRYQRQRLCTHIALARCNWKEKKKKKNFHQRISVRASFLPLLSLVLSAVYFACVFALGWGLFVKPCHPAWFAELQWVLLLLLVGITMFLSSSRSVLVFYGPLKYR